MEIAQLQSDLRVSKYTVEQMEGEIKALGLATGQATKSTQHKKKRLPNPMLCLHNR
jgi:hypothetical protein